MPLVSSICHNLVSMCWEQSVDMQDPWISLRNLWIPSSRMNPWIAQKSVDRAGYDLPIYRFFMP